VIKKAFAVTLLLSLMVVFISGCKSEPEMQLPPAIAPPAQLPALVAPVPAVAAVPVPAPVVVAPPATPLIPIEGSRPTGSGGNIDGRISGQKTDGSELLGNYTCAIKTNDLPLGINPPPVGCKIYRSGDGSLKIGPTGKTSAGSMSGNVTDTKAAGFYIIGKYRAPGGKFDLKVRMKRKGKSKFSGAGRGVLNNNKKKGLKYTLTMTK